MKHSDKVENLQNQQAIEKMQELIKHNAICMFGTYENSKLQVRPMSVQEVDGEGTFWLLSARESQKNQSIAANTEVQLFFSNAGDSEFLSVSGIAEISTDREKIEELWNQIAKAWFTKGKDDPSISVLKVVPSESYYWDTRNGKMISLLKIAAAAVTGRRELEGVHGKVEP